MDLHGSLEYYSANADILIINHLKAKKIVFCALNAWPIINAYFTECFNLMHGSVNLIILCDLLFLVSTFLFPLVSVVTGIKPFFIKLQTCFVGTIHVK